jgi:hypothetical protein
VRACVRACVRAVCVYRTVYVYEGLRGRRFLVGKGRGTGGEGVNERKAKSER